MSDSKPTLTRREVLAGAAAASAVLVAARDAAAAAAPGKTSPAATPPPPKPGPIVLSALPYAPDALAPVISANTLSFHYGKHHQAYVDKTNELVAGTDLASKPLEEIVKVAAADPAKVALFNNAAQVFNHDFYWKSLAPKPSAPSGKLLEALKRDFGLVEDAKKQLVDAALGQFGSGWAWLVVEGGKLKVVKTPNAETPLTQGLKPLLTVDVWEHAYYLDFQNKRKDYAQGVVDKLLNWEFAEKNFG